MNQHHAVLFLLSGTGNSLNAALRIQENMESCEILSIPKVIKDKKFNYEAGTIGFVFPVHFQDAPYIVQELLNHLRIGGDPYIFAVATSGGEVGKTFRTMNRILARENRTLHAEFSLVLPSNSIVMEDRTSTPVEVDRLIKNSEFRIDEIITRINKNKSEKFISTKAAFRDRFGCFMGKIFLYRIFSDRSFRVDNEKCIRCGTCVSVCPMNNIEIIDDKVTWNHHCECCLACIHWCPRNAIEHMKTQGIPRYHHPHIRVKQIKAYKSIS